MSAVDSLNGGDHAVITADADAIVEGFPEPPKTFRLRSLPTWAMPVFRRLNTRNLVVATATHEDPTVRSYYTAWKVDEHAWAYARKIRDGRTALCPCGHAGLGNHGDHYECGFAGCDGVFTRSELEVTDR